jgi:hypothetical protein
MAPKLSETEGGEGSALAAAMGPRFEEFDLNPVMTEGWKWNVP